MASRKHIAAGSLLTAILIVLGFGLGLTANKYLPLPSSSPQENPPPVKPNTNVYYVSAPNQGRVNITVPFALAVTGTAAYVTLPKEKATGIKEGQYILLYDDKNNLLPVTGTISSVIQGTGSMAETIALRISIETGPDVRPEKIAKGEAVIDAIDSAPRLPVTALVYHNDESAHIWEAVKQSGGTREAKLRPLFKQPMIIGEFFVLERLEYESNVYVLNPDDKLQEGQAIAVSETLYQSPLVPNPETIAEQKAEWVFEMPQKTQSGSGCNLGCGVSATSANYIEQIKAMAREQAEKPAATP